MYAALYDQRIHYAVTFKHLMNRYALYDQHTLCLRKHLIKALDEDNAKHLYKVPFEHVCTTYL